MGVYDDRRVKIVATLGPASTERETLRAMMVAGMDICRINTAHGSPDERARLIEDVRAVAAEVGKMVPILLDLRGLKIRTGPLAGEKVPVARGTTMEIVNTPEPTTASRIGIDFPSLFEVIQPGSRILISDGLIELLVDSVREGVAIGKVGRGGLLLGRQGVTLPGAPIKGGSLTETDRVDLEFGVEHGVDFIGLSFVTDATDLKLARQVASWHGSNTPGLIAKIERPQALDNVASIAATADGLMVARGDLGVQMPAEKVPRAQKEIIRVANEMAVPVITATQMLESMITQPVATRAETSDVANAVWDGTDAVMLSAESAVGAYPVEAVATMGRIIREAEAEGPVRTPASSMPIPYLEEPSAVLADSIARAARELTEQGNIQYLVVFTLSGASVRRVAKYRPVPHIIGVAADEDVARRLNLIWGVRSTVVPLEDDPDHLFRIAGRLIIEQGLAPAGEYALIVGSLPMTRFSGRTNMLHVRPLGT
ncbi:MAG: pyruvate kinase [Thermomicrobiales bacterium]|nr:pyruvate kinase [Thermomicrobiales bacterium]